jgi:hypothetical protein
LYIYTLSAMGDWVGENEELLQPLLGWNPLTTIEYTLQTSAPLRGNYKEVKSCPLSGT